VYDFVYFEKKSLNYVYYLKCFFFFYKTIIICLKTTLRGRDYFIEEKKLSAFVLKVSIYGIL
jgi:hypothetical protein